MEILFNTRCWNHDYYGGGNVGRRLLWLGLSYVYRISRKTRNDDISFTGDDFYTKTCSNLFYSIYKINYNIKGYIFLLLYSSNSGQSH